MSNIPTGTTLNGHSITYWNRQTEADGDVMSTDTIMPICSAINDNIKAIETMQAATDVIDVFGTFSAFEENSGTLTAEGYLTDKDIIKVLEDETSGTQQTYYQYSSADNSWSAIGALDPYYSKSDIDTITANIETEISTNYLKADNVNEGNNITITKTTTTDGPNITIGTKDDVSFNTVSSTGFSGTNISGGSKTATIDNLITSAEGGSAANSWLTTNINNYISAIGSADMKNITGEISTGTIGSAKTASIKLSGYKTIFTTGDWVTGSTANTYDITYGLSDSAITYMQEGHEASAWITNNIDDYVKHSDTQLVIGNVGNNLIALDPSTALGYGVSSKEASFGIGTDSNNINKVVSKSFVYGEGNSAYNLSIAFGVNNLASSGSFAGGYGNSAYNYSFVYGVGVKPYNTSNNIISFGNYPVIGQNSIFTIGNGNIENKHNVLNLNNDGTLQLYDFDNRFEIVNTAAKIYSSLVNADEYIGISQGWNENSVSYTNISSKTLLCFGPTAATFNLTIGSPGNNKSKKFRIMRCLDDWWNLQIGIASGYDICFKNFNTNNTSGGKSYWYSAKSAVGVPTTSWDPNLESAPILKSDCYMEIHDTESASHFFNLQRIYNNTYFDVEVNTKGKVVVFIKGGFVPDQTTY